MWAPLLLAVVPLAGCSIVDAITGDAAQFELEATATITLPVDAVTGDFDGDDMPDVAVALPGVSGISVFRGGDGLDVQSPQSLYGLPGIQLLAVHDFDRDDTDDLAVARYDEDQLSISFFSSPGTFDYKSLGATALEGVPVAMVAGALGFDNGGIVVLTDNPDRLVLVTPDGGGSPITTTIQDVVEADSTDVAIGDFNKDGREDLVYGQPGGVTVLYGIFDGGELFSAPSQVAGESALQVETVDLDSDDADEIAYRTSCAQPECWVVGFTNIAGELLYGITSDGMTRPAQSFAVGALNFEPGPDIAIVPENDTELRLALSSEDNVFEPLERLDVETFATMVVSADFDDDHNPDLAVLSAGELRVFRNTR